MNIINQGQAALTDQQRVQFAIDMVKTWGVPPQGSVSCLSNWCLFNWFGFVRNVKDEEVRLRLGREFLALETDLSEEQEPRGLPPVPGVDHASRPTCSTSRARCW